MIWVVDKRELDAAAQADLLARLVDDWSRLQDDPYALLRTWANEP